jgi:succinate-semialdehyde dehydrogenase / glutarate-semialdehyde dehydrogenase
MGKPVSQAEAEIEKCAWALDYFAEHAREMLKPETRASTATRSWIQFPPLGVVLAIMPWNFPYWQVIRFAAPALAAGNTVVLKHASNVPQCAAACEQLFEMVVFPEGIFSNVYVSGREAGALDRKAGDCGRDFDGGERAGAAAAEAAGRTLKKCVLELGGSDPFIVLADADLEKAVESRSTLAVPERRPELHRGQTLHHRSRRVRRVSSTVRHSRGEVADRRSG